MSPTLYLLVGIVLGAGLAFAIFLFSYILVARAMGVKQSFSTLVTGREEKLLPPVVLDDRRQKKLEEVEG